MNQTSNPAMVVAIVVALIVVAALVWVWTRQKRTTELKRRFGPEYDRALNETGDARRAEADLERRAHRVDHYEIRPLAPEQRSRFRDEWRSHQARFVDEPHGAVTEADHLVSEVMRVRGYPMANFEQLAADVSVDHPHVVESYRAAHAIAERDRNGEASTEDLRKAMVYFRSLFDDLLADRPMERGAHA